MVENFQAGDTVKLKSGGPTMSVTSVADLYGTMTAWVSWFDQKGEAKSGTYPIVVLVRA